MKTIRLNAACPDYVPIFPTAASVELTPALIASIQRLQQIAIREGIFSVTILDKSPIWLPVASAGTATVEDVELIVSQSQFRWQGMMKGTQVPISTAPADISAI